MALDLLLTSLPSASFLAKHLLELFENVSKAPATALLLKLVVETFESREALTAAAKRILASKRVLLLLVPSHAGLVVHSALRIITQSFVRVVDARKFLLSLGRLVNVGMELLGQFEVRLLHVGRRSLATHPECFVEVSSFAATAACK